MHINIYIVLYSHIVAFGQLTYFLSLTLQMSNLEVQIFQTESQTPGNTYGLLSLPTEKPSPQETQNLQVPEPEYITTEEKNSDAPFHD